MTLSRPQDRLGQMVQCSACQSPFPASPPVDPERKKADEKRERVEHLKQAIDDDLDQKAQANCRVIGRVFFYFGLTCVLLFSLVFRTAVRVSSDTDVHNIGLLAIQLGGVIFGSASMLAGAICLTRLKRPFARGDVVLASIMLSIFAAVAVYQVFLVTYTIEKP